MNGIVRLVLAIGFGLAFSDATNAYSTADHFRFPLDNYTVGCNPYWGTCVKAWHLGEDAGAPAPTQVKAIANGVVKEARLADGYGSVYIIEHTLSNGEKVVSVTGHLNYASFTKRAGDDVSYGEVLGEVGTSAQNGGWSEHVHIGIHKGSYGTGQVCGKEWIYSGYTACTSTEGEWYDPNAFIRANGDPATTITLPTNGNYAWEPRDGADSCVSGRKHYRVDDGEIGEQVSREEACSVCMMPAPTEQELGTETNWMKWDFWKGVFASINNKLHDLYRVSPASACEQTIVYRNFAFKGNGQIALLSSETSDLKVHFPTGVQYPIPNEVPITYPDIRIWSVGLFDGDRELNEQENHIEAGKTYQINVYPVSEIADANNGTDSDIEHIETDTFVAYGISETNLDWKFLCRSYTRVENLTEDDPHKETCHVTIPEDAEGERLYIKSKGDATGEVEEDDEGNNWSDEFKEWFPIRGQCNLITAWAGLDNGKVSLKEGDHYGLKAGVQNIGTTACPGKSRISYEVKLPGGSYSQVADDGVDSDQLLPGDTQWEHTLSEPFTANAIGTYGVRVCADSTRSNEETNETDNCRESTFDVAISRSDLIVSDLYLKTSSGQVIRNGGSIPEDTTVNPYCVVTNQGNRNARNGTRLKYEVNVGTYRGDDGLDASDLTIGANKMEYMSEGFRLGDTGNRTYQCCADYQGSEPELNEGNNCATISFTVETPTSYANPVGYVDGHDCTGIWGWTRDADTTNPIAVHVYRDGNYIGWTNANGYRGDLPFPDKSHGFSFPLSSLNDGKSHEYRLYAINYPSGDNPQLTNGKFSQTCR